jgi:hypothetical protein
VKGEKEKSDLVLWDLLTVLLSVYIQFTCLYSSLPSDICPQASLFYVVLKYILLFGVSINMSLPSFLFP